MSKDKIQKIRCYFNEREWSMLEDLALANNMSIPKLFKVAGMSKVADVYKAAAAKLDKKPESEEGVASGGTSPVVQPGGAIPSEASVSQDADSDESK